MRPGKATILYAIHTHEDNGIGGVDIAEIALSSQVMKSVHQVPPRCRHPMTHKAWHMKYLGPELICPEVPYPQSRLDLEDTDAW